MSSRTRVPYWTPGFGQALRLVLRPTIAFFLFTAGGFAALGGSILFYEPRGETAVVVMVMTVAGIIGLLTGQLISVTRFRPIWVWAALFILYWVSVFVGLAAALSGAGAFPGAEYIFLGLFCFVMAFPCGILSNQHRWELFASFWPSVGWIGGVFVIINEEGRVHQWEQDKVTAWLPVPLVFLGCFLVLWIFYLASKQAMRVELWQSLSGSVGRRIEKKQRISAIPRKNVLPLLVSAAALFIIVAVLAPYLWRTGKGDHESKHQDETQQQQEEEHKPKVDGEQLMQALEQMAQAAKDAAVHLWPLLLLFFFYRPAKRALLRTHLLRPLVPTPPTERIDNHWEYVRIAAEDAGVVPLASDSVEQLLKRIDDAGLAGPGVQNAAAVYIRTRYGFTVAPGDPAAMREHALAAGKELRSKLTWWDHVRNLWRPLS